MTSNEIRQQFLDFFQSKQHENIFVLGDATDLPSGIDDYVEKLVAP